MHSSKDDYMRLGNAHANLNELDKAQAAFEKAAELDPSGGEAYFNIGNVYVLRGDLHKCIEFYQKANDNGFKDVELFVNQAGVYQSLGENNQAVKYLTKAIKAAPLRSDFRLQKAAMFISMDKPNEALETLEELQKAIPNTTESYGMQAQIYCGMNRHDKALEVVSAALVRFTNDVFLHFVKIRILVDCKKFDEAKNEIAEVKTSEFYSHIASDVAAQEAVIYSEENNLQEAAKALTWALKYEDDFVDEQTRYLLMNLYASQKDYDLALEHAMVLENTKSNSAFCISAMYYIPHILKVQNKAEEADSRFKNLCVYLRKLSVSYPDFYEAYFYRMLAHKELGETEKALELENFLKGVEANAQ
ncbi:MAG: tetratricopeptide repeat protein [Defluviitaleaceae bacterium]|nr:tetratricopeptide repeat protein [Defluviitaleaceae bacterium]MCL2262413.1 tetratricopeptide repeat protein [Defluviitaleaceae bacterium]